MAIVQFVHQVSKLDVVLTVSQSVGDRLYFSAKARPGSMAYY